MLKCVLVASILGKQAQTQNVAKNSISGLKEKVARVPTQLSRPNMWGGVTLLRPSCQFAITAPAANFLQLLLKLQTICRGKSWGKASSYRPQVSGRANEKKWASMVRWESSHKWEGNFSHFHLVHSILCILCCVEYCNKDACPSHSILLPNFIVVGSRLGLGDVCLPLLPLSDGNMGHYISWKLWWWPIIWGVLEWGMVEQSFNFAGFFSAGGRCQLPQIWN